MGGIAKAFGDDPVPIDEVSTQADYADRAARQSLVRLIQSIRSQLTPYELAKLQAAQAVTPGYNDLALGELERNAGRIAGVQGQLDAGQAAADVNNLQRYGVAAGQALRAADAAASPEYHSNLALTGQKFTDSLNAWSPTMTAGQRAEVERGLGRMSPGMAQSSAANAAEKAMAFGAAGQQQRANFSNAINAAAAALPTLRTGLNAVGVAQGRDSRTAPVAAAISPVTKPGQEVPSLAESMWGGLLGTANQNNQLRVGKFKDWGDVINQDTQSFGNIAGSVGGFGAG